MLRKGSYGVTENRYGREKKKKEKPDRGEGVSDLTRGYMERI